MSTVLGIHRRLRVDITDALVRRFWSRVAKAGPDDCWEWQAGMRNGYGAIKHQGRVLSAHRLSYLIAFGEPDDDKVIGHKCDNRPCCNPNHLEAITTGTNNRDARGRLIFHMARGEDVDRATLTEAVVRRVIRLRRQGLGYRRISRTLSVGESSVKHVIDGRTWLHVTGGKVVPDSAEAVQ